MDGALQYSVKVECLGWTAALLCSDFSSDKLKAVNTTFRTGHKREQSLEFLDPKFLF